MEYYNINTGETPYNNFKNFGNNNTNKDFGEKNKKNKYFPIENNANKFKSNEPSNNKKIQNENKNSDNSRMINPSEYDKYSVNLNNSIKILKSKLEEKEKEIQKMAVEYKVEISELRNILSNKEEKIKKAINTIQEKDNKINSLNGIIHSLTNEIDNLKISISSNDEKLEQLIRYKLINRIDLKNSKSIIEEFMPKYDGEDPLKFYDIIVDINSIKEFVNGWNILKNDRGSQFLKKVEANSIKIGVVGNGNKGKSFILSKISDIELPVGESIKTKGLSIKFPNLENHINRNITILDSAGQETPVLNNDKNVVCEENPYNKNNDENLETEKKLTEKSRDKLLTEFFLQNYIVRYSDLLIIVVGILTFSEQKLINKIKKTYSKLDKNTQLIVIHNLQSYVTINQVKTYINDTLLKSDTFDLKEEFTVSKDYTYDKTDKNAQWSYYYEPKSIPHTIHLIFAREKSEAGNFYNKKTVQHIYNILNTINEKEPLNLEQNIKELFLNLSSEFLETQINEKEIEFKDNKIKLNISEKNGELKLKKCSIDELGVRNFSSSGVDPKYCCYVHGNKLNIICEIPGEVNKNSFKVHADCENGKCIIKIKGNKMNDISSIEKDCKMIKMSREFGNYQFEITVEDYNIETNSGKLEKKDGLIKISYPIKSSSSELTFD